MRFSGFGVAKGFAVSLLVCGLAYAGLRAFGVISGSDPDDPAALSRQAHEALEAVRARRPGDRRPASYDAVLHPLDRMLAIARDTLRSPDYDPVRDYAKIRSYAAPVISIATAADNQARSETAFLSKEYRFNDQRGEATQYLANAMWERMNALSPAARGGRPDGPPPLPAGEMDELRRLLDSGLEAAPTNRDLWYIRGVVNRAEGLFAPAARDLERALELDPEYAAAWNVLGLVRISLREFDAAETALERARAIVADAATRAGAPPGEEYASIIYNLAAFHDGLAAFYIRENRVNSTPESQRLMARHVAEARKYLQEFLRLEPSGPDAESASSRLAALPR